MASIFKKALGVFVEFEEDPKSPAPLQSNISNQPKSIQSTAAISTLNQQDIDKFEKHFDTLFEKTNLPGPDYFEFFKMMETLEAHIPDEKVRISAVFSSLSIQGMTKAKLLETAAQYKSVVEADKAEFQKASEKKAHNELESRKQNLVSLEKKIFDNSELIKNLTTEISEAQGKMGVLKDEIQLEEKKLTSAKTGYILACDAIMNQINSDILKITTSL